MQENAPVEKPNPQMMKCVRVVAPSKVAVEEVPIPTPASGEVLIKVMAAPINPSDLALYEGNYQQQKKLPTIMGFEGAGLVVQNGGGMMGWGMMGKKVAFAVEKEGLGSYAQYTVVKSGECLPLNDDTSFEQGSMSLVNPLTAIAMLDIVKNKKEKCVIITAAASALGRIINRLFTQSGIQVINIIRREEQVEILKKEGAKYILNSSNENFEQELKDLAEKMNARTCFEAIGGKTTGVILRNMPKHSTVTVYGCLSHQNLGDISVMDLLFGTKTINSLMLVDWIHSKSQLGLLPIFYQVRKSIGQNLKSEIARKFKLEEAEEAIEYYQKHMSEGKIIMSPWDE